MKLELIRGKRGDCKIRIIRNSINKTEIFNRNGEKGNIIGENGRG